MFDKLVKELAIKDYRCIKKRRQEKLRQLKKKYKKLRIAFAVVEQE